MNTGPVDEARRDWWGKDPRSWALLFAAGVYVSRVGAYFPTSPPEPIAEGISHIVTYLPDLAISGVWFIAAVGLVIVALWRIPASRWQALLVIPPFLRASLYIVGAASEGSWSAVWTFGLFFGFGGMVAASLLKRPSPPGPRQ